MYPRRATKKAILLLFLLSLMNQALVTADHHSSVQQASFQLTTAQTEGILDGDGEATMQTIAALLKRQSNVLVRFCETQGLKCPDCPLYVRPEKCSKSSECMQEAVRNRLVGVFGQSAVRDDDDGFHVHTLNGDERLQDPKVLARDLEHFVDLVRAHPQGQHAISDVSREKIEDLLLHLYQRCTRLGVSSDDASRTREIARGLAAETVLHRVLDFFVLQRKSEGTHLERLNADSHPTLPRPYRFDFMLDRENPRILRGKNSDRGPEFDAGLSIGQKRIALYDITTSEEIMWEKVEKMELQYENLTDDIEGNGMKINYFPVLAYYEETPPRNTDGLRHSGSEHVTPLLLPFMPEGDIIVRKIMAARRFAQL